MYGDSSSGGKDHRKSFVWTACRRGRTRVHKKKACGKLFCIRVQGQDDLNESPCRFFVQKESQRLSVHHATKKHSFFITVPVNRRFACAKGTKQRKKCCLALVSRQIAQRPCLWPRFGAGCTVFSGYFFMGVCPAFRAF